MSIHTHPTDQTAFDPDAIQTMSRAFEEACAGLNVSPDDAHGREIIATRIIDLAREGVIDAPALRDRVLSESRSDA